MKGTLIGILLLNCLRQELRWRVRCISNLNTIANDSIFSTAYDKLTPPNGVLDWTLR